MHFITGGAFNGKRAWVKNKFPHAIWVSAYRGDLLTLNIPGNSDSNIVVFEGLELWVREILTEKSLEESRVYFQDVWKALLSWERSRPQRCIAIIGTDITKGIVPVAQEERTWRDLTGWVYQDLASKCERMDVIWYGINQTIKGEV